MTPKERFDTLINFPGWGNPDNAIWFVGIEEGGEWDFCSFFNGRKDEKKSIEEYRKVDFENDFDKEIKEYKLKDGKAYFRWREEEKLNKYNLYDNISKVCCKIFEIDLKNYREFRNQLLCQDTFDKVIDFHFEHKIIFNTFLTNLFPLGFSNTEDKTWNRIINEYKKYFDLDDIKNKEDYYKICKVKRFPVLQKNFEKFKPKILICFGKDCWDYFIECFKLPEHENEEILDGNKYYYGKAKHNNTLCLIVNHLSWPWADTYKNGIVREIKKHLQIL